MLDIFAALRGWLDAAGRARARAVTLGLLLAGAVLVAAGALVSPTAARVLLGGLAGVAWLLAGHFAWWSLAPARWQEQVDLRAAWDMQRRRVVALIAGGAWLLVIFTLGRDPSAPAWVLLGALNVAVLGALAHLAVADPDERTEWDARQEQAARQRAYQQAVKDGLVVPMDQDGNPIPMVAQPRRRWSRR